MDSRIELRHLRYFVAVADELHFGRAAQRLHIAQPALSQQIRQLEQLTEVTLFERSSRSVRLTVAGEAFLPRARELLQRLSADIDEAQRVSRGQSGRIDIDYINSAAGVLSGILREFARQRPGVLVRLHDGSTTSVLDRLERGATDVGIVRDAEARDGIELSTLREEPFVAVLPIDHELASRRSVTAAQLAPSPLILFNPAASSHAYARNLQPFREAGLAPDIPLHGSEWNAILHLVASGFGVTIAPKSATDSIPAGALAIKLGGTKVFSSIQLAQRSDHDNPLVHAFQQLTVS